MRANKSITTISDLPAQFKETFSSLPDKIVWNPTPEIELLLCCSRTRLDARCSERIDELAQREIDWDYILRTAIAHGVMPLLYMSLKAARPKHAPVEVLSRIRDYYHWHARRNLLLTREMIRLIRLMGMQEIPAVPYKGPVLAAAVYGDISLRAFSDLDLLVHKRDVPKAKNLLISQGYQLRHELTEKGQTAHLESRAQKDFAFISEDGLVKVELHWQITSQALFPIDMEDLWERVEETSIGGAIVSNLPAEDLLLILCVHGAKHYFARLEWVCDIAELIQNKPEMDWDLVAGQAGRLGTRRVLYAGLLLTNQLLGTPLPEKLLPEIETDEVARLLASQMRDSLFRDPGEGTEVFNRGGHRVALRDKFKDRMRVRLYFYVFYMRKVLTPNKHDEELLRLPGNLSFLYYLIRPIRLAKAYGPILLDRILNRLKIRNTRQPN